MPDVTGAETPDVSAPSISALVASPPEARGPFLPVKEYLQAFREDYARPEVTTFDKLECGQHFQEPGFSSWEAFSQGAWRESIDLIQEVEPSIKRQFDDAESRGLVLRRARYVELPPSDYLVWEMAVLHERITRGERIRIVVGQGKPGFQAPPPRWFSELVILGTIRLYELRYTPDGVLAGAYQYDDASLIEACRADFEKLYSAGEDFTSFHDRVTGPVLRARCAEASA